MLYHHHHFTRHFSCYYWFLLLFLLEPFLSSNFVIPISVLFFFSYLFIFFSMKTEKRLESNQAVLSYVSHALYQPGKKDVLLAGDLRIY